MTRDESLKVHLAEKVMGWHIREILDDDGIVTRVYAKDEKTNLSYLLYDDRDAISRVVRRWDPLDSWADAGMVWGKAREMDVYISLTGGVYGWYVSYVSSVDDDEHLSSEVTAQCSISEAIALATGWKEEA